MAVQVETGALHLDGGEQRLDLDFVGDIETLLKHLGEELVESVPSGDYIVHAVGHGIRVGLEVERHPARLLEGLVELEVQLPVGDGFKAVADVGDAVV